jgi:hypothetical protein
MVLRLGAVRAATSLGSTLGEGTVVHVLLPTEAD